MTTIVSTHTICSRQIFAGNNDVPPVVHTYLVSYSFDKKNMFLAYLQFLRFSLFRQYVRTCASLWTVERSESSAANRPVGRESGHNPMASKESPHVSWEARDEACFVTSSNTSYNNQPKTSLQSYSNMYSSTIAQRTLTTCIYYEIIINQNFLQTLYNLHDKGTKPFQP